MFFWITTPCILITHLYNVTFLIRVWFNFLNMLGMLALIHYLCYIYSLTRLCGTVSLYEKKPN